VTSERTGSNGELLLLAARQVAAAPGEHVGEHGEQLENLVGNRAVPTL
jgi:hypothetical protein